MASSITQSPVSVSYETSHSFSDEQIDIIKNSVAKGVSNDELAYFLEVCRSTGLNPLHRQIYAIMRKTDNKASMTIQTGIDGYRLLAYRSGRHAGTDDAIYDTETADHPNKATVTVYKMVRGVRCPFTATARWVEYCQTYNNKPSTMWGKFPYLMLAKCAEALALRKAFPAETSGIYTDEEMQQADEPMPPPALVQQVRLIEQPHSVATTSEVVHNPSRLNAMSVNEFCRKVRDNLTLTPKTAMVALGVKSLTGIDLDEAYKTLEQRLQCGEESQDVPEEPLTLAKLQIKSKNLGYNLPQWEQLKDDCHNDLEKIAASLEDVERSDLRQVTDAGVH